MMQINIIEDLDNINLNEFKDIFYTIVTSYLQLL